MILILLAKADFLKDLIHSDRQRFLISVLDEEKIYLVTLFRSMLFTTRITVGASLIPLNSRIWNDQAICVHVFVGEDLARKDTTWYRCNNHNHFFFIYIYKH